MNSTLPGCRTSYPSPRPLTQSCFSVPARTQSGLAWSAMQSHCNPPRGDSSRAGAIATRTDFWSDLDGPSANRLMCLRAERCANRPPLLLIPLSALPGLERTIGLIHLYPTPVALGSRLYRGPLPNSERPQRRHPVCAQSRFVREGRGLRSSAIL